MIITQTPFRVSLLGGGTDYPAWYREHGGAVLGFTINKYCNIFIRRLPPFFEHKHRIVHSQIELVQTIDDVKHPAVRAVLSEMDLPLNSGLEIQHMGDLPARSGLGSSSSFTVGLINAINALNGRRVTNQFLALEAIRIEQDVIKEAVGSQDQIWAAYGGLGKIEFDPNGEFRHERLIMPRERELALNACLMLFFTGISRFATEVASEKIKNLDKKSADLHSMAQMVNEGASILQDHRRSLDEIGRLLHESWALKRGLATSVSNSHIDEIYNAGREAGAVGGKLLGAGGGGFMLFYARPEVQPIIRRKLKHLVHVDFTFSTSGSNVVLYQPDGLTK